MQYKFKDNQHCRWCGVSSETLQHIVNCGFESRIDDVEAVLDLGSSLDLMGKIAERVEEFLERVEVGEIYEQQGTEQRRRKEEEELK